MVDAILVRQLVKCSHISGAVVGDDLQNSAPVAEDLFKDESTDNVTSLSLEHVSLRPSRE